MGDDDAGRATAAVQESWKSFARWGPYLLLAVSTVLSVATAEALMTRYEQYSALALTFAALALQLWWSRAGRDAPEQTAAGRRYYVVRTVLGFVLTWLNPFFGIYAVLGYYDSDKLLPPRWVRAGLLATAVTMAGSQSGGLPPQNGLQGLVFIALFFINAGLVFTFARIAGKEAELTAVNKATIAELERANARLEQALEENAGLHAQLLVQAREAGVSEERSRLAAEIHDTLAQGLAGIITQLQAATENTDPNTVSRHIDRAAALARQSLGEARRSVHNLAPAALEHAALPEALKEITTEWSAETGIAATFTVTGTAEPLHDEIEATVLRIAQEALTNTARHARATRVGVTLSFMDDEVTLDVRDDGRGFDPDTLPARNGTGGFGLGGMRARAVRIAGTVEVESEPGGGTAVSARVPLVRHG